MDDIQFPSIQKNKIKRYIIENIIAKKKKKVEKGLKKKYKVK